MEITDISPWRNNVPRVLTDKGLVPEKDTPPVRVGQGSSSFQVMFQPVYKFGHVPAVQDVLRVRRFSIWMSRMLVFYLRRVVQDLRLTGDTSEIDMTYQVNDQTVAMKVSIQDCLEETQRAITVVPTLRGFMVGVHPTRPYQDSGVSLIQLLTVMEYGRLWVNPAPPRPYLRRAMQRIQRGLDMYWGMFAARDMLGQNPMAEGELANEREQSRNARGFGQYQRPYGGVRPLQGGVRRAGPLPPGNRGGRVGPNS